MIIVFKFTSAQVSIPFSREYPMSQGYLLAFQAGCVNTVVEIMKQL